MQLGFEVEEGVDQLFLTVLVVLLLAFLLLLQLLDLALVALDVVLDPVCLIHTQLLVVYVLLQHAYSVQEPVVIQSNLFELVLGLLKLIDDIVIGLVDLNDILGFPVQFLQQAALLSSELAQALLRVLDVFEGELAGLYSKQQVLLLFLEPLVGAVMVGLDDRIVSRPECFEQYTVVLLVILIDFREVHLVLEVVVGQLSQELHHLQAAVPGMGRPDRLEHSLAVGVRVPEEAKDLHNQVIVELGRVELAVDRVQECADRREQCLLVGLQVR